MWYGMVPLECSRILNIIELVLTGFVIDVRPRCFAQSFRQWPGARCLEVLPGIGVPVHFGTKAFVFDHSVVELRHSTLEGGFLLHRAPFMSVNCNILAGDERRS